MEKRDQLTQTDSHNTPIPIERHAGDQSKYHLYMEGTTSSKSMAIPAEKIGKRKSKCKGDIS